MRGTVTGLDPTLVASPDSDVGILIVMVREGLYGLHYQGAQVEDRFFVSAKTPTDALIKHATARLGSAHKAATIATGVSGLKVTGTDGSTVEAGDTLTFSDGTRYQLTSDGTVGAAVSGEVIVSVESIDTGTVANRGAGETLTFDSPPAGIDADATVESTGITGAEDTETNGELAKRIIDSYQNPPAGGRFADFRQWATSVEGVHRAYAYGPHSGALTGRRGLGIIDVAILALGTGASRIPTSTVEDNCWDYIETQRPHGAQDFDVLVPTTVAQAVDATITAHPGYEFDWTKIAAVTVSSWTPATRTLQFSANISVFAGAGSRTLKVNDRILLSRAGVAGGFVVEVESIAGTDSVVLKAAPSGLTPAAADSVEPGGPLTQPLLDAVVSLFDDLAPARGTAADPDQLTDDVLRLSALTATLKRGRTAEDLTDYTVTGIKDVTIATPATNVTPTDNVPSGVPELIVYDQLNIHPALGV